MKITIRQRGCVRASYGWMQSMSCAVCFSPDMETSADPSRVLLVFVCSGGSHTGPTGFRSPVLKCGLTGLCVRVITGTMYKAVI